MKRSDIKAGYTIIEADGKPRLVVRDINRKLKILDGFQLGGLIKNRYNENLTGNLHYNDIIKIQDTEGNVIWERGVELSMNQIAEKFGIPVEQLRIKK